MVDSPDMSEPTPTIDPVTPRRFADFGTLVEAVDYAASGIRGVNFYSARGDLVEALPYSEMRLRGIAIARRLITFGVERGARVALIAETSSDFIAFFIGCQYASVLPVPLPLPTSFGGRVGYVAQLSGQITSCGASALIGPGTMDEFLAETGSETDLDFVGNWEAFLALPEGDAELRLPEPDDLAYLQYSSGSTRFPHGIAVTHRSLMANTRGMGHTNGVDLQENDRCVSWLPLYHDMGLVGTFLTCVACQASADYLATEDFARRPLQWLRILTRNKGTVTYGPTFGFDICARRVKDSDLADLDLSSLRVTGIGAEMIRPDVMSAFADKFASTGFKATSFVPSYGLAECTLAVSFVPPGRGIETVDVDERILSGEIGAEELAQNGHVTNGNGANGMHHDVKTRAVVNCGYPLPDYEVEIRAPDSSLLGERGIGQIFVRGESVMREYFNDPEATAEVLSKDRWLDTGDMGFMHEGSIFIIGRAKDMIIVNGRNYWPQDIEWPVEQLPGVRNGDIAAISAPGSNQEEVTTVLVHCRVLEPEKRQEFADMIKQQVMQSTGAICQVGLVPPRSLPRTSSGKLSRTKARTQFLTGGIAADIM